jgi:hypothetical protein
VLQTETRPQGSATVMVLSWWRSLAVAVQFCISPTMFGTTV